MRWGVALALCFTSTWAQAQTAPAAPPPTAPAAPTAAPAAAPPTAAAPPYYYPPPGYAYPPAAYQPPAELPYKEGAPIPVGYHIEERPRKGLLIAGYLVAGIPYGIGLFAAISADFDNQSGWLAVPFAGPWLYMGRREYTCDETDDPNTDDGKEGASCLGEAFLVMGLIADGVMQAAGGTLLLVGYLSPKKHVVRDGVSWNVRPMRIGTGQGLGLTGTF
jgi:hypothetical protein